MYNAIDLLASEYSWEINSILDNIYPDELIQLSRIIRDRKASEYLMQLRIVTNPHFEPKDQKDLFTQLQAMREEKAQSKGLDKKAFDALRAEIKQQRGMRK